MSYQERHDSTYSSNGKEYRLNVIFEMTKNQKPMEMDIDLFTWILPYTIVQESRVTTADLKAPILVFFDPDDKRWIVIDGAHRLAKAETANSPSLGKHPFVAPGRQTPCIF